MQISDISGEQSQKCKCEEGEKEEKLTARGGLIRGEHAGLAWQPIKASRVTLSVLIHSRHGPYTM